MICTAVVYPSFFTGCSNKLVMVIAGVTWSVTHYLLLHVPCCAKYMTEVGRGHEESRTPKLDIDNNDTVDGCTRPSHGSIIVSNLDNSFEFSPSAATRLVAKVQLLLRLSRCDPFQQVASSPATACDSCDQHKLSQVVTHGVVTTQVTFWQSCDFV
jgi:hypothetical protein